MIMTPCAIARRSVWSAVNPYKQREQNSDGSGEPEAHTKAVIIKFENAPSPPVGRAFVKLTRVIAQILGSTKASIA